MEKTKISVFHMFVLIFLFETGSIFLVTVGREARQDAWIAVLLGLFGGLLLFLMFYRLYEYYPDELPTTYVKKIFGKYVGTGIAILYMLYSAYMTAVVMRTFGDYMVTFFYPKTPMFIILLFLLIVMVYAIQRGIEVIGRTGEFLFLITMLIAGLLTILLILSRIVELSNLRPILANGFSPVLKATFNDTLYIPFGEMVIFALLLPYVKKTKKMKLTIFTSLFLSGLAIAISKILNIAVLGTDLAEGSLLPTLDLIQSIDVLDYLQRLDVFFIVLIVIGTFIKCLIFFFVAVHGTADVFNIKKPSKLAVPIGFVILMAALFMTSNTVAQRKLNMEINPLYVHLPFQVIFPFIMLVVAMIKNRGKATKSKKNSSKGNVQTNE